MCKDSFCSLLKRIAGSNQAEDQVSVLRKVVEMSGMNNRPPVLQKPDGEFFVRLSGRDAQDCVPSPLDT